MDYFISEINNILEGTRRSYSDYRGKKAQETTGIQNISDSFNKLKKTSDNAKKSSQRATAVRYNLVNIANQIKEITQTRPNDKKQDDETNNILSTILKLLSEAEQLLLEVESILNEAKVLDQHVEYLQPQIRNLEQQLTDFAQLAGLGLTAEALSHELSNIVDRVVEETEQINSKIKLKSDIDKSQVKLYIEQIKSSTRSFRKQLSHLAPSLRYVRETKDLISTSEYLQEVQEYYIERFKGIIRIQTAINTDFLLRINKGKLTQVLDNIILNSEYWLKEKKRGDSDFQPLITVEAQEPFIRVYDNGNGIENSLEDRIFQPFVTGKQKGQGRGLGLFIVQQLLESVGCDLTLLNTRNQLNRKFIFQINLSNVIET